MNIQPDKTAAQEAKRLKGQFLPGVSGNPAGRPVGARNRSTLAAQALLEGEAEQLTRAAIGKALEGDGLALRLCLERLIAPKRDQAITLALPDLTEPGHALTAMRQVIVAAQNGHLTPLEAGQITELLERWLKMVEVTDFAQRLDALETHAKANTP